MRQKTIRAVILMVLLAFLVLNAEMVASVEEVVLEKTERTAKNKELTAGVSSIMCSTIQEYNNLLEEATIVAPETVVVKSANMEVEEEDQETEQSICEPVAEIEEQHVDETCEKEIYFLAKGIHGEAGICDSDEKYRVGTVIMNRVERKDHPEQFKNDVESVLKAGYECYGNKQWFAEEPTEEEYEIARDIIINGTRVFDKTVVFQSKKCPYGEVIYKSQWHEYGSLPIQE